MTFVAVRTLFVFPAIAALGLACSPAPTDTPATPPGLPGGAPLSDLPPGHPPMPNAGSPELPGMPRDLAAPAHPARSSLPARLDIPAEVKASWKTVTLTVTVGGKAHNVQAPIGKDTAIPGSALSLHVQAYLPAFQIADGVITSIGNKPDNPAALVRLSEKGKVAAEGWVFQTLSDFDTFKTDKAQVRLLSAGR